MENLKIMIKKHPGFAGIFAVLCILALVVRLFIMNSPVTHADTADVSDEDIAAGLAVLEELSQQDPAAVSARLKVIERSERADELASGNFNSIYFDSVIMGDSHAEGFSVYNCLDSARVVAIKGQSMSTLGDQEFNRVKALSPAHVFLNYGMNDAACYGSNVDSFVDSYRTLIGKVREAAPGAQIHICSIFEAKQEVWGKKPFLAYVADYNAALAKLCQEEGIQYIDTTGLLTEEYYEPDCIHTNAAYHRLWLDYVAEVAGLLD